MCPLRANEFQGSVHGGNHRKGDHGYDWAPVGAGMVDWVGQFQALQRDGFRHGLSLETHWRGAGTPEASTRVSMEGLRKTLAKAGMSC